MKSLRAAGIGPGSVLIMHNDMDGGAYGEKKRPRTRASDAGSSISIIMDKPVATASDIQAVQKALSLKEIDIDAFVASLSLEDLEDKVT